MASSRTSNGTVALAVCAISAIELMVMGRAVAPLVIAFAFSYLLWIGQPAWRPTRGILTTYAVAVLVQCIHLVEEYRTGFYAAFPPVFGAEPWPANRFLVFNFVWLGIFVAAGIAMLFSRRSAFLVALFLGFGGGIGNGLGHLGLVARRGGYFPGAYSAVVALFAGAALLRKLLRPEEPVRVGT